MPKYLHIRPLDPYGYPASKGGCTIAYAPLAGQGFVFAMAKCHEQDNFCKKTGRNKAAGRLRSKSDWEVVTEYTNETDFVNHLYSVIQG